MKKLFLFFVILLISTPCFAQLKAISPYGVFSTNNTWTGSQVFSNSITPSQTFGIVGTTTNNDVNAGSIGEYLIGGGAGSFSNAATSANYYDVTSITLTAGDWNVTGLIEFSAMGSTVTLSEIGLSTTSGNSGTGLVKGLNYLPAPVPNSSSDSSMVIPSYRVSIPSTTTVYLKSRMVYSGGTPQTTGTLVARRLR